MVKAMQGSVCSSGEDWHRQGDGGDRSGIEGSNGSRVDELEHKPDWEGKGDRAWRWSGMIEEELGRAVQGERENEQNEQNRQHRQNRYNRQARSRARADKSRQEQIERGRYGRTK